MTAFSESFTKFVSKISEAGRLGDKVLTTTESPSRQSPPPSSSSSTSSPPQQPPRPGSPFILLLSDGEDEQVAHGGEKKQQQEHNIIYHLHVDNNSRTIKNSSFGSTDFDSIDNVNDMERNISFSINPSDVGCVEVMPDQNDGEILEGDADDDSGDDAAVQENDELRSHRSMPLTKEMFDNMFDESGRLVHEHKLRKCIFKGGTEDLIRKDVWKFLFELYPFNSTSRERDILSVENTVRYEAMKIRWKKLLKTLVNDYEGVRSCPKWYTGCLERSADTKIVDTLDDDTDTDDDVPSDDVATDDSENKEDVYNTISTTDELVEHKNPSYSVALFGRDEVDRDERADNTPQSNSLCETGASLHEGNKYVTEIDKNNIDNNTTQESNTDLQCKEIENISDALADAMLECDVNREKTHGSKDDQHTNQNTSTHIVKGRFIETPDYLCPEVISPKQSSDELIHVTDESLGDLSEEDDNDETFRTEKVFPNPFEMPPEYINTHESLYAQSENFQSLDFYYFETKNENENIDQSSSDTERMNAKTPSDVASTEIGLNKNLETVHQSGPTILTTETFGNADQPKLEQSDVDSQCVGSKEASIGVSCSNSSQDGNNRIKTDNEHDCDSSHSEISESESRQMSINAYDTITPVKPVIPNASESQNNNTYESDVNVTPSKDSMTAKHSQHGVTALATFSSPILDDSTADLSPTAKSLEVLSPWLSQAILASTPASKPKQKDQNSFEVEIEQYRAKERKRQESLKLLEQDKLKLDEELLGIVQNANKYVEENIKNISGRITPVPTAIMNEKDRNVVAIRKDFVAIQKAEQPDNGLFMSPLVSAEVDVFLSKTPSLKLVSDRDSFADVVDHIPTTTSCPYCSFEPDVSTRLVLSESLGEEQLKFMEIQAEFYAARQTYDYKNISESVRVIDKDVPRTDRELDMFSGDDNPGLLKLRDALLTFAFFHPEVGYAQGMNDIMARFLYVMDSEVEAYWMFVNYMEHFKNDFMEAGMLRKIALVEQLLMKMDRELYDFLQSMDMGLIFCHRWLLLNFKREFEYNEAIRLFEITSSRHLEVSSLEAEIERSKERRKEFMKNSAGSHMEEVFLSPEYPFDIFVCVAMLMECKSMLMGTSDISAIYQILSNLPTTLDLQNILRRSEELFYRYCRKTTVDCFQIIDDLEVKDFGKKKFMSIFSFASL